jgi:hypothetical protein
MGSTKFEGGLLQRHYNMKKLNYPKPKIRVTYKGITNVTMFTKYTNGYKDTKDITRCK